MSDEPKNSRRISACRFVDVDDIDERNDILFKDPETIEEWKASLNRCLEIVEDRMDDIERRIKSKPAVHAPLTLDEIERLADAAKRTG